MHYLQLVTGRLSQVKTLQFPASSKITKQLKGEPEQSTKVLDLKLRFESQF